MSTFVFTNWDPSVYPDLAPQALLMHMAIAALRYNTVLIRDQDLTFNTKLASVFIGPGRKLYRDLLEELFDTGAFRVNLMRPDNYHRAKLADQAQTRPIRARAEFVKEQSA